MLKKRGRKLKLTPAGIRILQRIVLNYNKKPLYLSVAELRENCDYELCIGIVRSYVCKCGIRCYCVVSKQFLSTHIVQGSKRWASFHASWDMGQWGNLHSVMKHLSQSNLRVCARRYGEKLKNGTGQLTWFLNLSLASNLYLSGLRFLSMGVVLWYILKVTWTRQSMLKYWSSSCYFLHKHIMEAKKLDLSTGRV